MIADYVRSVTGRIFAMNSTAAGPGGDIPPLLFAPVKFHIVLSEDLKEEDANKASADPPRLEQMLTPIPAVSNSTGEWGRGKVSGLHGRQDHDARGDYPHHLDHVRLS